MMMTRLSLAMIGGYQKWISPRKGFSCAHRVAYGGTGCSGYAKHRIAEVGLFPAIGDIRERFRACARAADELRQKCKENCVCNTGPVLEGEGVDAPRDEKRKDKKRSEKGSDRRSNNQCDACDCSVLTTYVGFDACSSCSLIPRMGCMSFGDDAFRGCGRAEKMDCDVCDCDIGGCG